MAFGLSSKFCHIKNFNCSQFLSNVYKGPYLFHENETHSFFSRIPVMLNSVEYSIKIPLFSPFLLRERKNSHLGSV